MYRLYFFFLFGLTVHSYAQDCACEKHAIFSEKALLTNLKNLSSDAFEGRRTGTRGAQRARKYIINEFHKRDVKPLKTLYGQPFSFTKGRKLYKGVNVLGLVKGQKYPNKFIVISAHYDHEGIKFGNIYNGADDNASGVCALFSFAEYFKKHPPQYSVILAAFDAEELGLEGSRFFVNDCIAQGKNVILNINMDMISRSKKNELYVVGARQYKKLEFLFLDATSECRKLKIVAGHDGFDDLDDWTYSSDHKYFHKAGIPFLYFGVEDHEDYHEPTDDYENIDPTFYKMAVSEIITVFAKIDKSIWY